MANRKALVQALLEAHAAGAVEELGDIIEEGDEFIRQSLKKAEIDMDLSEARITADALAHCLQRRYLRTCQAAESCSGRELMEQEIAQLNQPQIEEPANE